ncbi:MAG TPA: cytochrome c [Caulobacteraceae bacterium]|jgi:mono/diheme cytochrome c family protein
MKSSLIAIAAIVAFAGRATAEPEGKTLYGAWCQGCHQENGAGIKGAFPALAGDAVVDGAAGPLIDKVLRGKAGMPAFAGSLSDAEIAAVTSYVRGAFGNRASPVSTATVAARRAAPPAP